MQFSKTITRERKNSQIILTNSKSMKKRRRPKTKSFQQSVYFVKASSTNKKKAFFERSVSRKNDKENFLAQKQLKSEIKTIRAKVNTEISVIQTEIGDINIKLKSLLPGSFIKSRDFDQICLFQQKNGDYIEQIEDCLDRLASIRENHAMAKEDLKGQKMIERHILSRYEENLVLHENFEQLISENEEVIKELQRGIKLKSELKEAEDGLKEVVGRIEEFKEEGEAIDAGVVRCISGINEVHNINGENIKTFIEEKTKFMMKGNTFIEETPSDVVFDFVNRISVFDPNSFDQKIKDMQFNFERERVQTLYESFCDYLSFTLEEFKSQKKFSNGFSEIAGGFVEQIKYQLQKSYELYSDSSDLFSELKELRDKKEVIDKEIIELEELKYDIDSRIDELTVKNAIANTDNLQDSEINYMCLSQSINESFFNQSNMSLHKLEVKEEISKNRIIEAVQNFENFEEENEQLKKELAECDEKKKKAAAVVDQINRRMEDFDFNIDHIKDLLIRSIEKENDFIFGLTENKNLNKYDQSMKDVIVRFCLSLKGINTNFIKRLVKPHPSSKALFDSLVQVSLRKQEFIEEYSRKSKDLEEKLKGLKTQLDVINDTEISRIQQLCVEYNENNENFDFHDQSASKIKIITKTNLNKRESPLSVNFLSNVYSAFRGKFFENHIDIYGRLEAGLVVYQKANFDKEFNLPKFLELKHIKKSRVSLESQGFVKKVLTFDLFKDLVIIRNVKNKKREYLSLSAFNSIFPSAYSVNLLKYKIQDDCKSSKLMVYNQKKLILMERSEYSEVMIEGEDKRFCFVFDNLQNFVLIALASKLSCVEKFEEAHK